jgi:protocatechuate 3,4-dioxygenase beta subunit
MAEVTGQVLEAGTNTPVADAQVFVLLESQRSYPVGPPPTVGTDENGRYRFDSLTPGRYRIAARKDGFAPAMDPWKMQAFVVAAGQVLTDVTVVIQRGATIAGRVVDPSGQPLVRVNVAALLKRLDGSGVSTESTSFGAPLLIPFGQDQTSNNGEFRIVGLAGGEYILAASTASNHSAVNVMSPATTTAAVTYFPGTADPAAAQPVSVEAGEIVSEVEVRIVAVRAFVVSGVVTDDLSGPLQDAMVTLMSNQGGAEPLIPLMMASSMTTTDSTGKFAFSSVPAGVYTLQANTNGGIGGFSFGYFDDFVIGPDGIPRADDTEQGSAQLSAGVVQVTVEDADVTNLRIVANH